jgi:4-diphosphocytidyl-2-C-methyl-D-erythritol kinase
VPTVHRERAPAKLTRTLRVLGTRSDGFHLLRAEMVSLDLADELVIEEGGDGLEVRDEIAWIGAPAPAEQEGGEPSPAPAVPPGPTNLVVRALELAGRRAHVRLVKRIPPGAGLGGGSSDAAAVLRWAGATDPVAASRLGADVPFCIRGGRAMVEGIGEVISPLAPEARAFLLCTPGFGVATALVYEAFDEVGPTSADSAWPNDLERAAIAVEPRLARWRDLVTEATGRPAVLAGSGSTWFVECDPHEGPKLAGELARAVESARGRALVTLSETVGAMAP